MSLQLPLIIINRVAYHLTGIIRTTAKAGIRSQASIVGTYSIINSKAHVEFFTTLRPTILALILLVVTRPFRKLNDEENIRA